jgi:hypothetical protein
MRGGHRFSRTVPADRVSDEDPHSVQTFLLDGRVGGTWKYEGRGVRPESFEQLPTAVRRELDDEGHRLAAFHS